MQPENDDLKQLINGYLCSAGDPVWFPGLAERLVCELEPSILLSPGTYSTTRKLTGKDAVSVRSINDGPSAVGPVLLIEELADVAKSLLADNGLIFASLNMSHDEQDAVLISSAKLIGVSPSLTKSVETLVRALHILEEVDPEIDVSYSTPMLPFSIFLTVPRQGNEVAYRVAEAIVHEAMHLQLSLIERTSALYSQSSISHYSPWKRKVRPLSGIVHSLYVFSAISQWLDLLPRTGVSAIYARRRRSEIARDVNRIDSNLCALGLSELGQSLFCRLVATCT